MRAKLQSVSAATLFLGILIQYGVVYLIVEAAALWSPA